MLTLSIRRARRLFSIPIGLLLLFVMLCASMGGGVFAKSITTSSADGLQFSKVDPVHGRTLWASFLQNTNSLIAVMKSTDFGETWSGPMLVSNRPPGLDKDELAVRGNEIVVAYDDNLNTWATISLDGGQTWTTHEVFPTSNRFSISLSADAAIDAFGNIFIS